MKKAIIFILILIAIFIIVIYMNVLEKQKILKEAKTFNAEYEVYQDKDTLYGTDIVTIVNKAINHNEKMKIEKDDKGYYIDDGKNTIKVDLYMSMNDTTYEMETIAKVGVSSFISNFNLAEFKCKSMEYHENGKISKIHLEEKE